LSNRALHSTDFFSSFLQSLKGQHDRLHPRHLPPGAVRPQDDTLKPTRIFLVIASKAEGM
jgi:hypothetical protein